MPLQVDSLILDFEYGRDYKGALENLRKAGYAVTLCTTRIQKPMERHTLTVIEKLRPDAVLVRSLAALETLRHLDGFGGENGIPLIGDFSLNVVNSLSANWFLEKGLSRLTPGYDLNQRQLSDMLRQVPGKFFEVTVHQYLPAFHMEHCVFAAFLSKGSSWRDCGKPCEKHRVELRDHTGARHPLKADSECRNTMFNGKAQSAARLMPILREMGVRDYRIELLWESAEAMVNKVRAYREVLMAGADPEKALARLSLEERYGVTEGQLHNESVWKDRKKG